MGLRESNLRQTQRATPFKPSKYKIRLFLTVLGLRLHAMLSFGIAFIFDRHLRVFVRRKILRAGGRYKKTISSINLIYQNQVIVHRLEVSALALIPCSLPEIKYNSKLPCMMHMMTAITRKKTKIPGRAAIIFSFN